MSKRAERFLPGTWPEHYYVARDCRVFTPEPYYDFASMGVGACALGYADDDIDSMVITAIIKGSMSTLNCYEEVELAERLINLHPWADMAKFPRTGGEACAVAIRLARAATSSSRVAFCGYHGWHDWYLAANIANSGNLDGQLLPGLEPLGVPRELKDTAVPFTNIDELAKTGAKVIIMEPCRSGLPDIEFLKDVRGYADAQGAVLIFDEVTSGFRMNLGGIHLTTGVNPDLAVFGKALGNGYPIAAVIGKREIMEQHTFISSTMWSERLGFAAALATIDKMEREHVQADLIKYGEMILDGWQGFETSGIPPLAHINLSLEQQTYYAQEMLKRGYLVGASVYTTYAYTEEIVDKFIDHSKEVLSQPVKLEGKVIQPGFTRIGG